MSHLTPFVDWFHSLSIMFLWLSSLILIVFTCPSSSTARRSNIASPSCGPAHSQEETRWGQVKVRGLDGPDQGDKGWLWGHGMSPHCGERNWSLWGRWSYGLRVTPWWTPVVREAVRLTLPGYVILEDSWCSCRVPRVGLNWGGSRTLEGTLTAFQCEELLNLTNTPSMMEAELEVDSSLSSIYLVEVPEVVKHLCRGKVPGVDEIQPEMLRALGVVMVDTPIQHWQSGVWYSAKGVANWGGGSPVQKRGPESLCQKGGPESVCQLSHFSASLGKSTLRCCGGCIAFALPHRCDERRAEPQGKALDLPVNLRSYPHLRSWGMRDDQKMRLWVQAAERSFLRRVAGVSLRNRAIHEELGLEPLGRSERLGIPRS